MNEDGVLRYFRTLTRYDCTGAEQDFSECGPDVTTGMACSSVRLSCSGEEKIAKQHCQNQCIVLANGSVE